MKTQKLNIRQILKGSFLLVAALMLTSGVYAQKSIKTYELKELTANLFKSSDEILNAMKAAKEKKAFYEEEIVLEEWMTDLDYWAKNLDSSAVEKKAVEKAKAEAEVEANVEEEVIEETLQLEDWMLNYKWIETEEIFEEELEIEDWMNRPKNWNVYACG